MQLLGEHFIYSASDLNNFLECDYITALDREAACGRLTRPERDPQTELIARKGIEHERRYLERVKSGYDGVVELSDSVGATFAEMEKQAQATIAAMNGGAKIVYQGTFFDGQWFGRSDFLIRIDRPSARRPWSYEVADTKLALHTKPYFLIQVCFYSEQLERLTGYAPELMHVVLGNGEERSYRVDDYNAYYRSLKHAFLREMARLERQSWPQAYVPSPVSHCAICSWRTHCEDKREAIDHLSLVARLTRTQIKRLSEAKPPIESIPQLATASEEQRPARMSVQTFDALRRQARLQAQQRASGNVTYELLPLEAMLGFGALPEPDDGDVFFDMEGDPLYEPGRGLEYLFGAFIPGRPAAPLVSGRARAKARGEFVAFWGVDPASEKRAFERFIDFVVERRACFPNLHIYHYAPYEKTALRKLSLRHATREKEVDDLLRGEVLVDLYAVVRHALCVSQPSYSIKKLEAFYRFERSTDLRSGDDSILQFEAWLQHPEDRSILETIERYNEEDCRSTYHLLEWLLRCRREAMVRFGADIPWRPAPPARSVSEERQLELAALSDLQKSLLDEIPPIETLDELRTADEPIRARWLLGHLLAYHRREDKPAWWRLFDSYEKSVAELTEDREAIGGLRLCEDAQPYRPTARSRKLAYTYEFPPQEHALGANPYDPHAHAPAGEILAIDEERNRLVLKRGGGPAEAASLQALVPGEPLRTDAQRASLQRIARAYLDATLERTHRATLELLLRRRPRVIGRAQGAEIQPACIDSDRLLRIVEALDESYLFIQGPPGSGKSTIGSQVIVSLLAAGKRVAVMANSHKAIHNLLHKIEDEAHRRRVRFRGLQKSGAGEGSVYRSCLKNPAILSTPDNIEFEGGDYALAAGTSWLFAREALDGCFDYLFIDEAGQIALANALAAAPCARNVVLLGDPLQLAQVSQGSHPAGCASSVLEHLLEDEPTIPKDRGIFLDVSYRMHPQICRFISEAVYAGRLRPDPDNATQYVSGPGLHGSGLRFLPVEHDGNSRESTEEAQRIVHEVALLRRGTVRPKNAPERPLTDADILVVSPYNAQRKLIRRLLQNAGFNVEVGTVDKFQGQEAPVVFYSMATSSDDDIPRDIDFLFEKNRFNVAISRAQCLSVLVASPKLLEVRCSSVEQIAMVNILCRYAEESAVQTIPPPAPHDEGRAARA